MKLTRMFLFTMLLLAYCQAIKAEENIISKSTPSTSSNLEFRGIHLGMTKNEVKDSISYGTAYKYKYKHGEINEYTFLTVDKPLGCEGPDGKGSCYWIKYVALHFYDDGVIEIIIDSPHYSANKIDYYVKGWASFALAALIEKYGKPTRTNLTINDFNVLTVKDGYMIPLYEWLMPGREVVALTIGTSDYEYYISIKYFNEGLLNKSKTAKTKFKSNL